MYKYINETTIQHITEKDKIYFESEDGILVAKEYTQDELKSQGWKELVNTEYPQEKEFYHVETTYQDGDVITAHHELVKDVEPIYDDLVHHFIRQKYSENDEFKMARTGKDTVEWLEYNNYVNEVRERSKALLERWRDA
ncbi:hypothetical protein [Anaerorhabdus sp.]|uniref:hypothetical protein n=1 Tax=Anaerorhabdus sp. TaxID=1872524 RepID=UPI002B20B7D2|nr:hypothetical protein [Anaerorhabdus sp.]MEA4876034.1 hypothetical protein [Anaerorhabdus sp.]